MAPTEHNYGYFYSIFAIENYANSRGVSIETWAGLELAQLFKRASKSRLISYAMAINFVQAAVDYFDDDLLGVAVGQRYQHSTYGLLGLAMMSVANIGESLELGARYSAIAGSLIEFNAIQDEHGVLVTVANKDGLNQRVYEFLVLEIITGLRTFWRLCCNDELAININFDFSLSATSQLFCQHVLSQSVRWDEAATTVRIDNALLATQFITTNPFALEEALAACDQLMQNLNRSTNLLEAVRQSIISHITSRPSAKVVANDLNISERSLHRKLKEEGMSYKALFSDLLIEKVRLWEAEGLKQSVIAKRLGFTDASNFIRAKNRWNSD